jgi:uncharacterized protein (TIGR00730 family)
VDDRRMLQRDGHIERQVAAIDDEFRRGFETVNSIDRPAVSIFGSARLSAGDPAYELAIAAGRAFAERGWAVVTGGGPGIMEAANRGAREVGALSIGLNIDLPHEQEPNPYITPDLCFQFHYFAMRKFHFVLRAAALVVFPGGFGTLDELFDTLCLRQTRRMQQIPVILYGRKYWDSIINFQNLADEGVIDDEDLKLINYAETPREAWNIIAKFHGI